MRASPAVLDGPQPDHGQLLGALGLVEGRVVGLHHQQLRAAVDGVADQVVVGDLEADHVAEHAAGAEGPEDHRGGARDEVGADQVDLVGDRADEGAAGTYSANGTGWRLM